MVSPVIASAQTAEALGTVRLPRQRGGQRPAATRRDIHRASSADPVTKVVGQPAESDAMGGVRPEWTGQGPRACHGRPACRREGRSRRARRHPLESARVQTLRGGEYQRVWFNRAGTQYLIHLSVK